MNAHVYGIVRRTMVRVRGPEREGTLITRDYWLADVAYFFSVSQADGRSMEPIASVRASSRENLQ